MNYSQDVWLAVVAAISEAASVLPEYVTADFDLAAAFDSIDRVELNMLLEENTGIEIPDALIELVSTAGQFAEQVEMYLDHNPKQREMWQRHAALCNTE